MTRRTKLHSSFKDAVADIPDGAARAEITYSGYAEIPCSWMSIPSSSPSFEMRSCLKTLRTTKTAMAHPKVAAQIVKLPMHWARKTFHPPP